jgi:glycosyltransferase involved in cell wall biosynthesis
VTADRLRVTFLLPTLDLSGGCRVVAQHAEALHARGHTVRVIAGPEYRPTLRERARVTLRGQRHRWWPTPGHTHFADSPVPVRRLARTPPTADDLPEADALVATWWETAEWASRMPACRGAHAYFIQHHEVHMEHTPNDRVDATWRLPMHKLVVSGWLAEIARSFGDHDATLVPNPIDATLFDAPPRGRQAVPTLGFVYSDVPFKGTAEVLKAIGVVRERHAGLRAVCFAAKPPTTRLPLPAWIECVVNPPQTTLASLYACADVWLVGSHAEGFGLPIVEAMACRTPVVSTRVGAAGDVIEPGVNGLLVEPGDAAALAEATLRVLALPDDKWRAWSVRAYEAARLLTPGRASDLFEAGLLRAIDKARGRSAQGVA